MEQSQEACVRIVVKEEYALVEDRFLGLAAGALKHELR
jgi:hypothetical protein